jgi:hypothetical protein
METPGPRPHPVQQGGAERILASLVAGKGPQADHAIATLLAGEPFFLLPI